MSDTGIAKQRTHPSIQILDDNIENVFVHLFNSQLNEKYYQNQLILLGFLLYE